MACKGTNDSQGLLLAATLVPNAKAFYLFFFFFTTKHEDTLCAAPELVKKTDAQTVARESCAANFCLLAGYLISSLAAALLKRW